MNLRILIFLALLAGLDLRAQDYFAVRSRTDQFIVHGARAGVPQAGSAVQSVSLGQGHLFWFGAGLQGTNRAERLRLEPNHVAVSCERIKEFLLRELHEPDSGWRKIHVVINDRLGEDQMTVIATRFVRGWIYTVELPAQMETRRFTGAILETLLYELANRNAMEGQTELPPWLVTGWIKHMETASVELLALQPNLRLLTPRVGLDPTVALRERFSREMPLSFEEISWPGTLPPDRAGLFQDSAQLFVHELLRLKDGRACMRRFLAELPQHKNWQFAFLKAYQDHFTQLVDVEKWWALTISGLVGRDAARLFSIEESWQKLKAALDVPVQIHLESGRLPVAAQLSLQEIITEWDPVRQETALRKAAVQLQALRMRAQPDLLPLVDGYRSVIEGYLEQKNSPPRSTFKNQPPPSPQLLKKSACRQLDALDEQRLKLRESFQASNAPATEETAPQ